LIGNDVVDLAEPRCRGKADDRRFVERVFTEAEVAQVREAPVPERRLWLLWAAKESAFKSVSKLRGSPPPFEHRAFAVDVRETSAETARGTVAYEGVQLPFHGELAPDRIHVITWQGSRRDLPQEIRRVVRLLPTGKLDEGSGWRRVLRRRFTEEEWRSIHSPESALVRLQARADLARILGEEERALEIVCSPGPAGRVPPEIRLRNGPFDGDLSLSHHGRFLAWAFTLPEQRSHP